MHLSVLPCLPPRSPHTSPHLPIPPHTSPYLRSAEWAMTHSVPAPQVSLRSVAARSCLVCMALALGVSMQVFGSAVADAPTNLCAYQPDAASCEAFPALPDAQR